jgi:multicomponent Na+:H+ antiporter subunit C
VDSIAQSSSEVLYSNPLPHVLILTAIVVGVATLAIGLSLVVRVREVYGTIEEDKIEEYDRIYYKEILERQ